MILVDSSIYIFWARRRIDPQERLAHWIRAQELASCGTIRVEVLRGMIDAEQKVFATEFFDLLQEIPTDAKLWQEIAELAWKLDRIGFVVPIPDLTIACCALRWDLELFTLDRHFLKVPKLRVHLGEP